MKKFKFHEGQEVKFTLIKNHEDTESGLRTLTTSFGRGVVKEVDAMSPKPPAPGPVIYTVTIEMADGKEMILNTGEDVPGVCIQPLTE